MPGHISVLAPTRERPTQDSLPIASRLYASARAQLLIILLSRTRYAIGRLFSIAHPPRARSRGLQNSRSRAARARTRGTNSPHAIRPRSPHVHDLASTRAAAERADRADHLIYTRATHNATPAVHKTGSNRLRRARANTPKKRPHFHRFGIHVYRTGYELSRPHHPRNRPT